MLQIYLSLYPWVIDDKKTIPVLSFFLLMQFLAVLLKER